MTKDASNADLARDLVARAKIASLGTVALRPAGHPFVTLVGVATDERRRPVLLLSSLAEHTKNLEACANASLLFADPTPAEDPLALARVTVVGECRRVPESEIEAVRERYLAVHPEAKPWAAFKDFAFYRLEPTDLRIVVGFGRMSWLEGSALSNA